jgi:trimethylamine---corrinoid protein Co-methyltransferase
VDEETFVVRIPEQIVQRRWKRSLASSIFTITRAIPKVQYGGDAVHFDPGSSGITILDPETLEHKDARTPDLIRILKVAEQIPQYDAQSTAVVCTEVQEGYPGPVSPVSGDALFQKADRHRRVHQQDRP